MYPSILILILIFFLKFFRFGRVFAMSCLLCTPDEWGRILKHTCALMYLIPHTTEQIKIVNFALNTVQLRLSSLQSSDDDVLLESKNYRICLCNTPEYFKRMLKIGLV